MEPDEILDRRRLKRRLTFWRVAAVLAVVALIAVGIGEVVSQNRPYVARLPITGFIGEDVEREAAIRELADDDNAKALVLRINSPGGTTTGAEELFHAIRHVAEKKPVVAVIGTVGASGGYVAAIAADHIIARETSLTGSVGVLFQTAEFSGLLEKIGVTSEALKSGPLKGEPSPVEPMDDQVRAAMQALLEDGFDWFRGLVRERRGLSDEELRVVTDGRVFTGRQAHGQKLIDELGGEATARAWLEAEHDVSAELDSIDIVWGEEAGYVPSLIDGLAGKLLADKPLTLDGLISVWHPN